jgi:hypothetical protein
MTRFLLLSRNAPDRHRAMPDESREWRAEFYLGSG